MSIKKERTEGIGPSSCFRCETDYFEQRLGVLELRLASVFDAFALMTRIFICSIFVSDSEASSRLHSQRPEYASYLLTHISGTQNDLKIKLGNVICATFC